ncbi:MAG TPA: glycosyltransferase [Acidimicrobiales bacterium]|nr:glycosyltransferase [Acidimicrobiales bacterium]
MRVLHVVKDFLPPTRGGMEQHVSDLCRSLPGFEFSVLTSSRGRRRHVDAVGGVEVVRAPEYARLCSTPVTPGWWRDLRRHDADLVHLHLPNPFAEMAVLVGGGHTPMVASYYAEMMRSPALARRYGPVQERFLGRMEHIVVSSPALAVRATPLRAHRDRVVVIPFGVDPAEWPADDRAVAGIRARHPGPIVLFLGRLVWYKGVHVLIEAMTSVPATLLVVGDGPERTRLEALVRHRRLGPRVRFVGEVSDWERASYQRAADLFVLPSTSRAETFGIAMLEAMSVGTPVVSTEVGTGTSWVNRSGETGLVVPPRDPRALAGAITSLLGEDDRRRRLGLGAARRARDHFPKAAMLAAFADLYRSMAPRSAPSGREQAVRPGAER